LPFRYGEISRYSGIFRTGGTQGEEGPKKIMRIIKRKIEEKEAYWYVEKNTYGLAG
jgi:hypothetical protein